MKVRYIVAHLDADQAVLLASVSGGRVGLDAGWYRLVYDDRGRDAIQSGPHATAEEALAADKPGEVQP